MAGVGSVLVMLRVAERNERRPRLGGGAGMDGMMVVGSTCGRVYSAQALAFVLGLQAACREASRQEARSPCRRRL